MVSDDAAQVDTNINIFCFTVGLSPFLLTLIIHTYVLLRCIETDN